MRRRGFLAILMGAGTTAQIGCSGPEREPVADTPTRQLAPTPTRTPSENPTPDESDERLNIVEAGADPTGQNPIDRLLEKLATDSTHLYFPQGQYRLGEFSGEYQNLVLSGDGARILPEEKTALWSLLDIRGENNTVDGFVFDYRNVELPPMISIEGPDGWIFRNCTFLGRQDTNLQRQGGFALLPNVTDTNGRGLIENVYLHEGSAPPTGGDTRGGIWFGPKNRGTLRINKVWMEQWAENTIYAHNTPGDVIIENSFFRNTNVAGTRVGGNTVLRNNTYIKTGPIPKQTHPDRGGRLMRGVWISGGKQPYGTTGSVLVEDCDFYFTTGESTGPAILQSWDIDGELVIKNCHFQQDAQQAIKINAPTEITLENVQIRGNIEMPAIVVHRDASTKTLSGAVATSGPISNRPDIIAAFQKVPSSPPDTSPPKDLERPANTEPIPSVPDELWNIDLAEIRNQ